MSESENYASVWDAIADTPGQAANPRARAELMQQIAELRGWTQDRRSVARLGLAPLAGRVGEHLYGARLPRAGRSRSSLSVRAAA